MLILIETMGGGMARCELCREQRPLKKSHLLPKAAYRHVRDSEDEGGGSPLRVNLDCGEAFYTDKQVDMHLLCGECEQRFSKFGENPVSRLWATKEKFPLLDKLSRSPEKVVTTKGFVFYPPTIIDPSELESLFYFGVSVVWRSNCWDWGRKGSPHKFSLGPYEPKFRNYLLGINEDLEDVKLMLALDTNPDLQGLMAFPYHARSGQNHFHRFNVLGLYFDFVIGRAPNDVFNKLCNKLNSKCLITSRDMATSKPILDLAAEFQKLDVD